MKKILITGGSHAEMPMIEESKRAGWYVITTGTNCDGMGHKLADNYIPGDFSDREFVLRIARENKVQAILSGCNDFAYISTAYACDVLGLPGHDSLRVAETIHHKDKFRQMTNRLGIHTPKVFRCYDESGLLDACGRIQFPLMIKPVDLTGGKGVRICQNIEEAVEAFLEAKMCTRESFVIAEEYIRGTNHGSSMLLKNQKVVWSVFDDEQYYLNKYLVSGASMPAVYVSQAAVFQLIHDVEKIASHLKLVDGLFHTQFIIEENGLPVIIDPCRRAPGDIYVLLAKYVTGVNYPAEIVKAETGQELQASYYQTGRFIARECIMADKPGRLKSIRINEIIMKHIVYKLIWGREGEKIEDVLKYKAGILIMEFEGVTEMQEILKRYHDLVTVEIE